MTTRVLVVDDSPAMRALISRGLGREEGIEVVGVAADAFEARELIKKLEPDVITLDILMPKLNGLEFLEKLMRLRPMPVVMCSALTAPDMDHAIYALELGAVDVIAKPGEDRGDVARFLAEIAAKVRAAARSPLARQIRAKARPKRLQYSPSSRRASLIAIGASTGGPDALMQVLASFPQNTPPVVITQHMPSAFLLRLAERMTKTLELKVSVAQEPTKLEPGMVLFAPGDRHLTVAKQGFSLWAKPVASPPHLGHLPAVDVMFNSIATLNNIELVAAILTGMGRDGAEGLKALRAQGHATIVQNEATCVVFGMPRAAIEIDAADQVCGLADMTKAIFTALAAKEREV